MQDDANLETKSSMGDKYETSRSMINQEKEKLASQLSVLQGQSRVLRKLNLDEVSEEVKLGSLVVFEGATYFISVALGRINIDGQECFAISPVSPLGKTLVGAKKEENVNWRSQQTTIEDVY